MKQFALFFACVFIGFCAVSGPTGCKSPPQTIAYQSLATVAQSMEAARQSYNVARRAGHVTQAQETKVLSIWSKYQSIFKTAADAARLDYGAPAPAELQQVVSDFIATIKLFASL